MNLKRQTSNIEQSNKKIDKSSVYESTFTQFNGERAPRTYKVPGVALIKLIEKILNY